MSMSIVLPSWQTTHSSTPSGPHTNKFQHLRLKRENLCNSLRFLVQCKNNHVIPSFIKLRLNTKPSPRIKGALRRAHFVILRAIIKDTRHQLATAEEQLYHTHLLLSNKLHPYHWNLIDSGSFHRTQNSSSAHQSHLKQKLENLRPKPTATGPEQAFPPSIVNISSVNIPEETIKVLNLGLKFAVSHKAVSADSFIAPIEKSFKHSKINPDQLNALRYRVKKILLDNCNNSKKLPPTNNLTQSELKAISDLRNNKDILVLPSDKGGQTAILDKSLYTTSVLNLIQEGPYRPINQKRNPVLTLFNKTTKNIKNATFLTDSEKFQITPSRYNAARLYALPKLHKNPISFRPIISCIGLPTAQLSSYLAAKFSPLLKFIPSTILNSVDFISKLNLCTATDHIMISLDIKSMFTNVPVKEALNALQRFLIAHTNFTVAHINELVDLTKLCISNNFFSFDKKLYLQTEGMAMGNSLSGILCDLFMHDLDIQICNIPDFQLSTYFRYVDDIFSLYPYALDTIPSFLTKVNNIHPAIQFTIETEISDKLNFLDTTVSIDRVNNKFHSCVYRKPCFTPSFSHSRSAQPFSHKISALYSYVYRALKLCSDQTSLAIELNTLKHIAINRGYNPNIIDQAVKKYSKPVTSSTLTPFSNREKPYLCLPFVPNLSHQIGQILSSTFNITYISPCTTKTLLANPKDPIPLNLKSGIYKISCLNCDLYYIGQTKRSLYKRIDEHRAINRKLLTYAKANKNTETKTQPLKAVYNDHNFSDDLSKSALTQHCISFSHNFNFDQPKIIVTPKFNAELNYYETLSILKHKNNIVNGDCYPSMNNAWLSFYG